MRQNNHAFANQLLICLLVSFGFGGSIGLGTVYLRHQITVTAKANRSLQASIAELRRKIDATTTAIETEQGYDSLNRRNTEWSLGLVPATDAQVVRVTEDPVQRLIRRRDSALFNEGVSAITLPRLAQKN
jgi:hypothetical protein